MNCETLPPSGGFFISTFDGCTRNSGMFHHDSLSNILITQLELHIMDVSIFRTYSDVKSKNRTIRLKVQKSDDKSVNFIGVNPYCGPDRPDNLYFLPRSVRVQKIIRNMMNKENGFIRSIRSGSVKVHFSDDNSATTPTLVETRRKSVKSKKWTITGAMTISKNLPKSGLSALAQPKSGQEGPIGTPLPPPKRTRTPHTPRSGPNIRPHSY